jgi:hypothetical protein
MFLWINILNESESKLWRNMMAGNLIPKVDRLKKLYRGDQYVVTCDRRKGIIRMQKRVAKALDNIVFHQPP